MVLAVSISRAWSSLRRSSPNNELLQHCHNNWAGRISPHCSPSRSLCSATFTRRCAVWSAGVFGPCDERVEVLELEKRGIRVPAYLTELPPRQVLEQKLHDAVRLARARLG